MASSAPTVEMVVMERVVGYRRLGSGLPLRRTMETQGVTLQGLADRTRADDPDGRGVNFRTIGFLVSQGSSGRETCTVRVAEQVAAALGKRVADLFTPRVVQTFRLADASAFRRDWGHAP